MSLNPPPYDALAVTPVLYDETHHGKQYMQPQVMSMANSANMMGYLPYHAPGTDGSFAMCLAGGNCTLVSKALYESIPQEHRPSLSDRNKGTNVQFLTGENKALGSTIMPIVMTDSETGHKFCIKLYALVMENLFMGMFIGQSGMNYLKSEQWGSGGKIVRVFDFGDNKVARVEYSTPRAR